jgi:HSP20 family protein
MPLSLDTLAFDPGRRFDPFAKSEGQDFRRSAAAEAAFRGSRGHRENAMKSLLPDFWTSELVTDPFGAHENVLGRDFSKAFAVLERESLAPVPAMNIAETENFIEATLEIPGVDDKDIEVRVDGYRMIVSGEKTMETNNDETDWHLMERRYGSFYRSVQLPFEPATDAITAHTEKGVLHLTVQKPAAKVTTAKTIPVMAGPPKTTEPRKPN